MVRVAALQVLTLLLPRLEHEAATALAQLQDAGFPSEGALVRSLIGAIGSSLFDFAFVGYSDGFAGKSSIIKGSSSLENGAILVDVPGSVARESPSSLVGVAHHQAQLLYALVAAGEPWRSEVVNCVCAASEVVCPSSRHITADGTYNSRSTVAVTGARVAFINGTYGADSSLLREMVEVDKILLKGQVYVKDNAMLAFWAQPGFPAGWYFTDRSSCFLCVYYNASQDHTLVPTEDWVVYEGTAAHPSASAASCASLRVMRWV